MHRRDRLLKRSDGLANRSYATSKVSDRTYNHVKRASYCVRGFGNDMTR